MSDYKICFYFSGFNLILNVEQSMWFFWVAFKRGHLPDTVSVGIITEMQIALLSCLKLACTEWIFLFFMHLAQISLSKRSLHKQEMFSFTNMWGKLSLWSVGLNGESSKMRGSFSHLCYSFWHQSWTTASKLQICLDGLKYVINAQKC